MSQLIFCVTQLLLQFCVFGLIVTIDFFYFSEIKGIVSFLPFSFSTAFSLDPFAMYISRQRYHSYRPLFSISPCEGSTFLDCPSTSLTQTLFSSEILGQVGERCKTNEYKDNNNFRQKKIVFKYLCLCPILGA